MFVCACQVVVKRVSIVRLCLSDADRLREYVHVMDEGETDSVSCENECMFVLSVVLPFVK